MWDRQQLRAILTPEKGKKGVWSTLEYSCSIATNISAKYIRVRGSWLSYGNELLPSTFIKLTVEFLRTLQIFHSNIRGFYLYMIVSSCILVHFAASGSIQIMSLKLSWLSVDFWRIWIKLMSISALQFWIRNKLLIKL